MTKLFEQAIEAARALSAEEQDTLAHAIFGMVAETEIGPVALGEAIRESIRVSREQIARGEFASDAEIEAIWARHT